MTFREKARSYLRRETLSNPWLDVVCNPTEHMTRAGVCALNEKRGEGRFTHAADLELVEAIFNARIEEALK